MRARWNRAGLEDMHRGRNRDIDIPEPLFLILEGLRQRKINTKPDDFVLVSDSGLPLLATSFRISRLKPIGSKTREYPGSLGTVLRRARTASCQNSECSSTTRWHRGGKSTKAALLRSIQLQMENTVFPSHSPLPNSLLHRWAVFLTNQLWCLMRLLLVEDRTRDTAVSKVLPYGSRLSCRRCRGAKNCDEICS